MTKIAMIRLWSLTACGLMTGLATAAAQGSAEQRRACGPDAVRLCREFIPNVDKVSTCMTAKKAELSEACRNAMFAAKPAATAVASSHRKATRAERAEARAERRAERKAARNAKTGCETAKGHKRKNCKVVSTRG